MDSPPTSVGLAGDGDEISAVQDVERAFGVRLDYDDAANWITAGDLFASLNKKLSPTERSKVDVWERFAIALSQETGVNPQSLSPKSPLISVGHMWRQIQGVSALVWFSGLGLIAIIALAAAFFG